MLVEPNPRARPRRRLPPSITAPLLVLAAAAMVVTGCGIGADASDEQRTLDIYSGRSQTLVEPVIQQFSDATGIRVNVRYGSTGEMAATLLEEGDRPRADLFFAQDPGGLGAVEQMLAELPDDLLERVPEWARSPQGTWVGISGRARVIVYNTDVLTEADLPESIRDFTGPEWNGRLGWAPSNGSFQTMVTAMRAEWGEADTEAWLRGIMDNSPREYANNTALVTAAAAGEIDAGFTNHYYLHRFLAEEGEGFKARNYYLPEGGPGSLVMVAGAGILERSDSRQEAEAFIRFMLSPVAQQYFASQTFEHPLVDGVAPPRGLPDLETLAGEGTDVSQLADVQATQALLRRVGALP